MIFFQVSAYFVTYTLITALLRDRFGADTTTASGIMFGFGILGALNSSGLFAGIAFGSFLGGRIAQTSGVANLPLVSLLLTALALAALTVSRRAASKHGGQLRSMRAA